MQKRLGQIWIACAMAALSLMGCAAAGARPREAFDSQTASLESAAAPAPAIDEAKMAYGEGNDAIQSASLSGAALDRKIILSTVDQDRSPMRRLRSARKAVDVRLLSAIAVYSPASSLRSS